MKGCSGGAWTDHDAWWQKQPAPPRTYALDGTFADAEKGGAAKPAVKK